jgi:hypothetical protein
LSGSTSDGIAWTIEIVESVVPTRIPPPISIVIEVALAEITAPAKEIIGGTIAKYFLSSTSESRPTIGERTLCISNGPYKVTVSRVRGTVRLKALPHLNDPPSNSAVTEISYDESNDRASCYDDKDLSHDTGII